MIYTENCGVDNYHTLPGKVYFIILFRNTVFRHSLGKQFLGSILLHIKATLDGKILKLQTHIRNCLDIYRCKQILNKHLLNIKYVVCPSDKDPCNDSYIKLNSSLLAVTTRLNPVKLNPICTEIYFYLTRIST